MERISKISLEYLFYINGFLTIPRLSWLSTLIRICIIGWTALIVFLTFYWKKFEGDTSVGGLVGSTSFLLNCIVNVIIILEAITKSENFDKMTELQQEVNELLAVQLNANMHENLNYSYLSKRIALILLCQLIFDGIKVWINCITKTNPVFWYLLPITISLRTRYIQIIVTIMAINRRTLLLRDVIESTVKANEPKSIFCSDIWQPYDPKDYEKVNYMRLVYLRIWEVYMNFNNLYSWSLLMLLMSSLFDIICNCYWTLTAGYESEKYVMHGATSLSLACLICVLFYFTDASENNSKIYKAAILFMYLGYWIFGISPFTNNYRIHQVFVMLWYCEIALLTYLDIVYDILGDRRSLNRLVSTILYVAYMLGHLTVLIESCNMSHNRAALFEKLSNIRNGMEEKLKKPQNPGRSAVRLSRIVIGVLVLLGCCHGTIMWTTFNIKARVSVLYWRSLQCYLALQFKTLELLTGLMQLNYYIVVIRQNVNDMGERNLRRVYKILNKSPNSNVIHVVPFNDEEKDEKLLKCLKGFYNEIFATFEVYNKSYGWSLLVSTAVYFVGFVCSIYWILLALLNQGRDYYNILQNASHALMAFVLLAISCWYADECYYESRYIGALISKLAKPLGNKHYNDLVTEFSIQTLHQRFNVTAKEFFCLNLNLLGGMIAAIVTYLVILLQFMFTEKSKIYVECTTEFILTASNTTNAFEI